MKQLQQLNITPEFSRHLPADPSRENRPRPVARACFSFVNPVIPSAPEFIHYAKVLAQELGLELTPDDVEIYLSGQKALQPDAFQPFAMCYAGHQFGQWAGQLGDGRAIVIAEAFINDQPFQFQLKGAGPTPYSRGADGFAVLRSSIREYLCSEAMHHLGIPTTRALSLVKTGDAVTRDILYSGHPQDEPGAIVCRVARSFIRFGNFELFAAKRDIETLKTLVDYTITTHFSHLGTPSKEVYLDFFREVVQRTKKLMIHWQRVGFVHGVMNTDNMSIHGLTIDYGPYGWLENYDPEWTPNTTDKGTRRYRFGNQPNIGLWNLVQLANALYALIEDVTPLEQILESYKTSFHKEYHEMMLSKLGLQNNQVPVQFVKDTEHLLTVLKLDYTIFFRLLSERTIASETFKDLLIVSSYLTAEEIKEKEAIWVQWVNEYLVHLQQDSSDLHQRQNRMKQVNPKYVLRNYMAQLAIEAAEQGSYDLIDELYELLQHPYDAQPEHEKWFAKRPDWAEHKIGCSMLSCSS